MLTLLRNQSQKTKNTLQICQNPGPYKGGRVSPTAYLQEGPIKSLVHTDHCQDAHWYMTYNDHHFHARLQVKEISAKLFLGSHHLGQSFLPFYHPPPHAKVLSLNEAQVPSTCRLTQLCQSLSPNESFFPSATIYPPAKVPDFRRQKLAKAGGKLFLFSDFSQIFPEARVVSIYLLITAGLKWRKYQQKV